MELRYLRYFVAVASTHHFTRAAEILGISQPPLSQQIQKLEREIGTPLFKRLTRGVEMTEAGEAFYQDANHILQLTDSAIDRVRSIARGESGSINVGFSCAVTFHPLILMLLRRYRQHFPSVKLQPREEHIQQILESLRNRNTDIAFVRLPCDIGEEFDGEILTDEPMQLVLPDNHPLSKQTQIQLSDLNQEPLIIFPRELSPSLYDMTIRACYLGGYEPKINPLAPHITATISMVASGFGVSFIPKSLSCIQTGNVSYHEVDTPHLTTQIAAIWRAHERSAAIMNMVQLLRQLAPHH
ncbi:LysR family transcriptional regulator [Prodigiosinella aquatilis]|nr:LysR family transcriptional regulator [Prodigiosinella sp. LS101]WJV54554.1 LysR family transcriptional regulator [Prodigiosinella sp. LS101]WJV58916.1 LysR family transcriptional regulator [Pectobacteriaceae bacterium C111]